MSRKRSKRVIPLCQLFFGVGAREKVRDLISSPLSLFLRTFFVIRIAQSNEHFTQTNTQDTGDDKTEIKDTAHADEEGVGKRIREASIQIVVSGKGSRF